MIGIENGRPTSLSNFAEFVERSGLRTAPNGPRGYEIDAKKLGDLEVRRAQMLAALVAARVQFTEAEIGLNGRECAS